MTPVYVICYMVYTTFTSTILSLLLGFRLLRRRVFPPTTTAKDAGNVVALYEGTLHHERRHPIRNSFRFTARYALIDLDRPPYSPPTFLSSDEARRAAKTNGPVVTFVFNPSSDSVPKCEYISPFSDMLGNWRLKVSEPGDDLYAYISVEHPDFGNNYFIATLKAKKVSISSTTRDDLEAFFWLQPHKGSIISYWNGVKLWWKNVRFYEHPRKQNPAYRGDALARNGKNVQICPAFGGTSAANGVVQCEGMNTVDRCFMWKDAPWSWSYLISPRRPTSTPKKKLLI